MPRKKLLSSERNQNGTIDKFSPSGAGGIEESSVGSRGHPFRHEFAPTLKPCLSPPMELDRHAVEQLSPLRDGPGAERERERVLLQSPHCRLIADPMSLAAPESVIDLRRIRKLSETVTHDWVDEEDVTKEVETSPRTTSAEDERTTGEQAVSLEIYFRFLLQQGVNCYQATD